MKSTGMNLRTQNKSDFVYCSKKWKEFIKDTGKGKLYDLY